MLAVSGALRFLPRTTIPSPIPIPTSSPVSTPSLHSPFQQRDRKHQHHLSYRSNENRLADGTAVLPPIPTTGLTAADADKLTQRTRDAMMNELMRLSHLRWYEDGAAVATGVDGGSEARRKVGAGL